MRQNAPQKRGRGRPNGGGRRTFSNPVNRTYESSGPDVKVRGTAMHIFDKYQALARDATSSGDRIAAENYLQHAEHYFRLMMAAQAAQAANQQRQGGQPQGQGDPRDQVGGTGDQPDGDMPGQHDMQPMRSNGESRSFSYGDDDEDETGAPAL